MSAVEILDQLRALPAAERREVVERIWDEFADTELGLTPAQAAELDRRLEEHEAHSAEVMPWSEIKAATEAKFGRES